MNCRWIIILLVFLVQSACNTDTNVSKDDSLEEINIRLRKDPGKINPLFEITASGRELYQYIFLPVADFHPESLELYPILIESIPEAYETTTDNGEEAVAYDLIFRDAAQWSDGQALTATDYAFTIDVIKHPLSKATRWKPYLENILSVKLYEDNPNKVTVYLNPDYMLSQETCVSIYPIPLHIYDPNSQLDITAPSEDTLQISLMDNINNAVNDRVGIVQAGPYHITDEASDEYLVLGKRENYWGDKISNAPSLQGYPKKMIFKIVPDDLTALTMAKEGKLDFFQLRSANDFLDLRDNHADSFSFHTPQLMFTYYIPMNNKSEILSDKIVRKALSYLIDVEDIIQTLDGGLGVRTIGPFHPTKSYYNESITPISYDINKAKKLLSSSGWQDTDNDGILDKVINGKRTPMELEFLITGSPLSKNIALIFQQNTKKAGVKLNIVAKKMSVMRKENLYTYKYDMAALAKASDVIADDPYSSWHSDNAIPGGSNTAAYNNSEVDALIQKIRQTRDAEKREVYYLEFQKKIYEDQPMIFLYSPLLKFVGNHKLNITTTSKRPGYMANTFTLKDEI